MPVRNLSFRKFAFITGLSLLLMAVLAGLANFTVVEKIKTSLSADGSGEVLLTMAKPGRWAVLAFAFVASLDVIVSWSLYGMFRQEMPALSLLTAWFRLLYTAVFSVAIAILYGSFRLAPDGLISAINAFHSFEDAWTFALFFFGIHLTLLGWISIRSRHIHWLFGVLLIVAGGGYTFDSIVFLVAPDSNLQLALYTFIGEVVLIFRLLIRGSGTDIRDIADGSESTTDE